MEQLSEKKDVKNAKSVDGQSVKFVKLHLNAVCPYKKYKYDAGYDLTSIEDVVLTDNAVTKIRTGIAVEIPEGYVGILKERSSLGSMGVKLYGGVIDATYRGEILVCLAHPYSFVINTGMRIAQMLIVPVLNVDFVEVEELSESNRQTGGFGSTGI